MTLGAYIKTLRTGRGVSHQELANRADLNRNTVINIENDESIRFDTLRTVLNALELSPAEWGTAANLWIRQQIGESDYLKFGVPAAAQKLVVSEQASLSKDARQLADKLAEVDHSVRAEILKAAHRPEIVECLRVLNAFHEKVAGAAVTASRKTKVLYSDAEETASPRVGERSGARAGRTSRRPPRGK